jgi:hypothetical protein
MSDIVNINARYYKVIPCECDCYDFYIKESFVAVCQNCDHEIIIKNSELPNINNAESSTNEP